MLPTLQLGPFAFPTAGLVYIFGAYVCLLVIERAAMRLRLNYTAVYALGTVVLFAGLVGARALFVAEYWAAFRQNLLGIIWPLNTGYNVWGGLLIGAAAGFFYGRYKQFPTAKTLDALAPGLIMALMVVSLADFLAGPGFGALTDMPWGVSQFGVRRHPVQLYEILVGATALLAWLRATQQPSVAGRPFLVVTAVYSAGRLFVDAYRANAWLTAGGLHVLQIVALILLVASLFWLGYKLPQEEQIIGNRSDL